MSQENRLYPAARHSEEVTRKIVRCFAEGLSLEKAAERSGLEKRRVRELFGKIREAMAPHFDTLADLAERSPQWATYKTRVAEQLRLMWMAEQAGALRQSSSGNLTRDDKKIEANADRVKQEYYSRKEELDRHFFASAQTLINTKRSQYVDFMRSEKRGVFSDKLDLFEKEYRYRFAILCCCRCNDEGDTDLPVRTYADGLKEAVLQKPDFKSIYAVTEREAKNIERHIFNVLEAQSLK